MFRYKKLSDGNVQITYYLGDDENVIIPEMIGKGKVTSIAHHAFSGIRGRKEENDEAINKIKIILGITGEELKYEAKSDDTIIGAASSYSDADIKLAEAIRTTQGNAITIQPGNGVNITSNGSVKTINVKVVNDDKLITVDNSGIHTKDNAVFDCGTY